MLSQYLTLNKSNSYYLHYFIFFFFNDTATTEIYTLSLHDALPIAAAGHFLVALPALERRVRRGVPRSEEHTSELQSRLHLVCRLLLEKKKTNLYICFERRITKYQQVSYR